MKVLHLASFHGNIGDNANHSGFRPWFERLAGPVEWTDWEIREFYRSWGGKRFDESHLEYVNRFDLLVIGGGNYFELWVDHSPTGTSVEIPLELFAKIRPPVFFNALGCDAGQGTQGVAKFNAFLDMLDKNPRVLITLRNDGAKETLRKHVPAAIAEKIATIPDGGFFLDHEKLPAKRRIGINLASDMAEVRFSRFAGGIADFCREFAAAIDAAAARDPEIDFMFFPHIFRDLEIVSTVIASLSDKLRRTRVSVAPYVTGAEGAREVFGLYSQCEKIAGMRFHANVCALGMGLPTIGLCNYPQVRFLYQELNRSDRLLDVDQPGFASELCERMVKREPRDESVLADVTRQRQAFEPRLASWLRSVA